jgi:hypothetical protein
MLQFDSEVVLATQEASVICYNGTVGTVVRMLRMLRPMSRKRSVFARPPLGSLGCESTVSRRHAIDAIELQECMEPRWSPSMNPR